jgi:Mrp family chromosome partitioning ATPase
MRKSEEEFWKPGTTPESARPDASSRHPGGPLGLVPSLSTDVLAYYEAIGKQVEVALGETAERNLVFTGAVSRDGISTVLAQFAEMLSRRGERVLLIDGNPRHPSLHHQFGLPESPGLAEFVAGTAPREAVVHRTGFAKLDLVPLGRCSDRSEAEQITEGLGAFHETFAAEYDYVLVDTDFIGSPFFSQTAVAAGNGVVLVIRAGKTNRQIANRACETVRRIDGRILGVVLNRRQFPIPKFIYRRL